MLTKQKSDSIEIANPESSFKKARIGCGLVFMFFVLVAVLSPDKPTAPAGRTTPLAVKPPSTVANLESTQDNNQVGLAEPELESELEPELPSDEDVRGEITESIKEPDPVVESEFEIKPIVEPQVWFVSHVVDGDTFEVVGGSRVRLIGINTPEKGACFADETTARAIQLLKGKSVQLVSDPTQSDLDIYGRMLRYAILPDGRDFGQIMIQEGLALEYTYRVAYENQGSYRNAESSAELAGLGLWAPDACNTVEPEPILVLEPISPQTQVTSVCDCTGNLYNCSDFDTHSEAQICYDHCIELVGSDIHRLDGNDNDGLACEGLPK